MAADKSYARLGLFVIICLVVVLGTGLFFLERLRTRPLLAVVTYTTENISGLDVSSPVRFRGVTIGRVSDVGLRPDGSIIEIDFEIFLDRIRTLGANVGRIQQLAELGLFSNLRAQVLGNPVTGDAYLLLDLPKDPPSPMALNFTPDRPYIPTMPSPLNRVQDRLPEVIDRAEATLRTFDEIVARVPGSLDRSDRFFTNLERIFRESDIPTLSADSRKFFATTSEQLGQLSSNIEKVVGTGGTVEQLVGETHAAIAAADLPATTQATRNASQQASLAAQDFRRSLPAIRESLDQLRELAKMLEDQPESVVYGRRPPPGKSR
jgi:paraquat-inducible protein B